MIQTQAADLSALSVQLAAALQDAATSRAVADARADEHARALAHQEQRHLVDMHVARETHQTALATVSDTHVTQAASAQMLQSTVIQLEQQHHDQQQQLQAALDTAQGELATVLAAIAHCTLPQTQSVSQTTPQPHAACKDATHAIRVLQVRAICMNTLT